MKTIPKVLFLLAGAVASALLTGCTMTKVSYEDAPLTPVKFESPAAAQTFYNAVLAKYFPTEEKRPTNGNGYGARFYLPMPLWYEHDTRKSYHVIANDAVAMADANHDGTITEAEAAYAATIDVRTDQQKEDDAVW